MLEKDKVLITGANGMLGSSICNVFSEDKLKLIVASHRDSIGYSKCDQEISIDLGDRNRLAEMLTELNIDIVVHCAGLANIEECEIDPRRAFRENVNNTENVVRACGKDILFVYISTDQVYGEGNDRSEVVETLEPINHYGYTKYLAEKLVSEMCPEHIIVRTNIFGWNVKPGKVSSGEWIFNLLSDNKMVPLFIDYKFSPIYTGNFSTILLQLIKTRFRGVINIGSPDSCSKYEFGIAMAEQASFAKSLVKKKNIKNHSFVAKRPRNLAFEVQKAIAYGIALPSYENSINRFLMERYSPDSKRDTDY